MQPSDSTRKELPREILVRVVHLLQESSDTEGEKEIHYVHSFKCQRSLTSLYPCLLLTNKANPQPSNASIPLYALTGTQTFPTTVLGEKQSICFVPRHLPDGIRKKVRIKKRYRRL